VSAFHPFLRWVATAAFDPFLPLDLSVTVT